MKKYLFMLLLCLGAFLLGGCKDTPESSMESETEPETTTVATTTTTVTTTTVTTTTTVDYRIAEELELEVGLWTVRTSKCTATLTNHDVQNRRYTLDYRIIDEKTGKPCKELPDYEPKDEEIRWLAPEESKDLEYDWSERYGELEDGNYILEAKLDSVLSDPEDADSDWLPLVARSEFGVNSQGFVPHLSIDPETIRPEGVVLTVQNSPDAGRTYTVFRLYDESREPRVELLKRYDYAAQRAGNNHVDAGGTLTLNYDWAEEYGSLVAGTYVLEIDMIADNEKEGKVYRIEFEVK